MWCHSFLPKLNSHGNVPLSVLPYCFILLNNRQFHLSRQALLMLTSKFCLVKGECYYIAPPPCTSGNIETTSLTEYKICSKSFIQNYNALQMAMLF